VNQCERLVARVADAIGGPDGLGQGAIANHENALVGTGAKRDHAVPHGGCQPIEHQSSEGERLE